MHFITRRNSIFAQLPLALVFAMIAGMSASFAQNATPIAPASPGATPEASPIASVNYEGDEFLADQWRIAIVTAERQQEFSQFGLESRPDKDWVVVIADVTNWSRNDGVLNPKDFALKIAGPSKPRGFARKSTEQTAEVLGLEPESVNEGVEIDATDTVRVALVFEMPIDGTDPALFIDKLAMPLTPALDNGADLEQLPDVIVPGETVRQSVESVEDGQTLLLGANNVETRLGLVDAPTGDECFAQESTARLRRLVTDRVLVEIEDANSYVWSEESDGTRRFLNFEQVEGGYGAVPEDPAGRFATWMQQGEEDAQDTGGGLWTRCTGPHGVERTLEPERSNIRVSDGEGGTTSYRVWLEWAPELVTTPDGGAWAFFSALADSGPNKDQQRLYASRFDPTVGTWRTAEPMPAGVVQFGASAVVDSKGMVHVVFSARETPDPEAWSTLLYTKEDGRGGWIEPEAVSIDLAAGHQIAASLTIDRDDNLYVAWQDQRAFGNTARDASPLNADIFVSEKTGDGFWSIPVIINNHSASSSSLLPRMVVDGDRLVAIWSVYTASTGSDRAARMDWAMRPLKAEDVDWTAPQTFANGRGDSFGGKYVDLAADPTGGAVAAYARAGNDTFLFTKRLKPDAAEWSDDVLVAFGDRGSFPTIAINSSGDVFVGYNADTGTFGENGGVLIDVAASAIGYRSLDPGPEVIVTRDDPNSQGRPELAIDITGKPWFVYFGEIPGFAATQVGALRNANVPIEPLAEPQG